MYTSRRPAVIQPNNTMFVHNFSDFPMTLVNNTITNGALTGNIARYFAFSPPYDTAVQSISVWCVSGTTQNFDIGLYDESFVRLGSLGSTGIASTTGIKTWTPTTPIAVAANTTYFAAFATDSNASTWVVHSGAGTQTNPLPMLRGHSTEASTFPLPATGTPTPATGGTPPFLKIVFSG